MTSPEGLRAGSRCGGYWMVGWSVDREYSIHIGMDVSYA